MSIVTLVGGIMLATTAFFRVKLEPSKWILPPGPDLIAAIYAVSHLQQWIVSSYSSCLSYSMHGRHITFRFSQMLELNHIIRHIPLLLAFQVQLWSAGTSGVRHVPLFALLVESQMWSSFCCGLFSDAAHFLHFFWHPLPRRCVLLWKVRSGHFDAFASWMDALKLRIFVLVSGAVENYGRSKLLVSRVCFNSAFVFLNWAKIRLCWLRLVGRANSTKIWHIITQSNFKLHVVVAVYSVLLQSSLVYFL